MKIKDSHLIQYISCKRKHLVILCLLGILIINCLSIKKSFITVKEYFFHADIIIADNIVEGNQISCKTIITYTGNDSVVFYPKDGVQIIFEHESGMKLIANYNQINSKPIPLEKNSELCFDCSDFGWYSYHLETDENIIKRVDYRLLLSNTPLFLIAGDYEVYVNIVGTFDTDSEKTISYTSDKRKISVTSKDERDNIAVFSNNRLDGKAFINQVDYNDNDSFYCFASYQINNDYTETIVYNPYLCIKKNEKTICGTQTAEDPVTKWTVQEGAIFITTPVHNVFANKHILSYIASDIERVYDIINLDSGTYEFVLDFYLDDPDCKISIPFNVK